MTVDNLIPVLHSVRSENRPFTVYMLAGDFNADTAVQMARKEYGYDTPECEWTFWARGEPKFMIYEHGELVASDRQNPKARRYWQLEKCSIYDQ